MEEKKINNPHDIEICYELCGIHNIDVWFCERASIVAAAVCVCVFFNETMNKQVAKVRATIHIKKKSNLYIRGAYSFPAFRAFGWNEASNARSHKSHWGNSHYLLFNRFADTDCAWILLDYGQPKFLPP